MAFKITSMVANDDIELCSEPPMGSSQDWYQVSLAPSLAGFTYKINISFLWTSWKIGIPNILLMTLLLLNL